MVPDEYPRSASLNWGDLTLQNVEDIVALMRKEGCVELSYQTFSVRLGPIPSKQKPVPAEPDLERFTIEDGLPDAVKKGRQVMKQLMLSAGP